MNNYRLIAIVKIVLVWVLFLVSISLNAQTDSLGFPKGTRKFYMYSGISSLQKNRYSQDPFTYRESVYWLGGGIYFRQKSIVRPFAGLGTGFGNGTIDKFVYDSSLVSLSPSHLQSIWGNLETGIEINPSEKWFFRLMGELPFRITNHVDHTELSAAYGIEKEDKLLLETYDFRYGVDVGRSIFRQRLDASGALKIGTRKIFSVPTRDNSQYVQFSLMLRYHLGQF